MAGNLPVSRRQTAKDEICFLLFLADVLRRRPLVRGSAPMAVVCRPVTFLPEPPRAALSDRLTERPTDANPEARASNGEV
jgi:hypothetical protein